MRGALEGVARHGVPLLPEPQRAGHGGDRQLARPGAQARLGQPRRPRARARAVRADLPALQGIRGADCAPPRSCRWSNGRWSAPGCWRKSPTGAATACASSSMRSSRSRRTLRPAVRDRLHHALSVVYGIEPYVILKDIWGLRDREVERTALWMADALIDAALREAAAAPAKPRPVARRRRRDRRGQATLHEPSRDAAGAPAPSPAWFDAQYNNRARIPEHPAILRDWADASAARARALGWVLDVAYGRRAERAARLLPRRRRRCAGVRLHPRRLLARARQARSRLRRAAARRRGRDGGAASTTRCARR